MKNFVTDPAYYDAFHSDVRDDIPFWVMRARRLGGRVLDLACGTGRISAVLSEVGLEVCGIDLSEDFLQLAARKAPRASFVRADIRTFSLAQKDFRLVAIPFRGVAVLTAYDDLVRCFSRAKEHIQSDGALILDTYNTAGDPPSKRTVREGEYIDPIGSRLTFRMDTRYDQASRIVHCELFFPQSNVSNVREELTLRHHSVDELHAAAADSGFTVAEHLGNYDGTPHSDRAPTQILVLKPQ